MSKRTNIIYWVITGLLCLQMIVTGFGDVTLAKPIVENIAKVGFPINLIPFLGTLKLLGAMVLLFVGNLHLRVVTYAGMIFYALGALFAHLTIGDPVAAAIPAAILLVLVVLSYSIWQKHYFPFTAANPAS